LFSEKNEMNDMIELIKQTHVSDLIVVACFAVAFLIVIATL